MVVQYYIYLSAIFDVLILSGNEKTSKNLNIKIGFCLCVLLILLTFKHAHINMSLKHIELKN